MKFKKIVNASLKTIKNLIINPASIFLVLGDQTPYKKYLKKKYNIEQLKTVDINTFLTEKKSKILSFR